MNIAFFLIPKAQVAFLEEDFTVRQALEKMNTHGYTAIPVVSKDGKYLRTVSEGDFLWHLLGADITYGSKGMKEAEQYKLSDVTSSKSNPPVHIMTTIEELLSRAMQQNFIPVIDDSQNFIGIVTRKDIIKHYAKV